LRIAELINWVTLGITTIGFLKKADIELVRLGSEYGGYWIPSNLLSNPKFGGFISVGLGRDISFDISLLEFGLTGIGIDPIEEYISEAELKIQKQGLDQNYLAICKALSPIGNDLVLFPPKNGDSWRSSPSLGAENVLSSRRFAGISLSHSMEFFENEIQTVIVKMDIEGIELEIIDSDSMSNPKIACLLVEFDVLSQISFLDLIGRIRTISRTRKSLSKLRYQSYQLTKIEHFNFTFVRLHNS